MEKQKVLLLEDVWGFLVLKDPISSSIWASHDEIAGLTDVFVRSGAIGILANANPGAFGEFYVRMPDTVICGNEYLCYVRVRPNDFELLH